MITVTAMHKQRKIISKIKSNLPNILTFFRLLSAPLFVIIFYFDTNVMTLLAGIIFFIAGLTDFLDGFLARHWNVESKIGRILDPIADKLIVIAAIVMLIFHGMISGFHIFAANAILLREVVISGLREAMSGLKFSLVSSMLGKFKTVLQLVSIGLLIFCNTNLFAPHINVIIKFYALQIFWISAILSIYSGSQYVFKVINYLKQI